MHGEKKMINCSTLSTYFPTFLIVESTDERSYSQLFFIRKVCSSSLPWFASIYLLGFFRSYRFQLALFQPEPASLKNWQCILGHERKWIISFYSFSSAVVIQSTLRKKLYIEPLGSEHIQGLSRKASENSGRYCGAAGRSQGISMCISSGSNN